MYVLERQRKRAKQRSRKVEGALIRRFIPPVPTTETDAKARNSIWASPLRARAQSALAGSWNQEQSPSSTQFLIH